MIAQNTNAGIDFFTAEKTCLKCFSASYYSPLSFFLL